MPCLTPYNLRNPRYTGFNEFHIPVPCGKCPHCLNRRTSAWSFRLLKEEEHSSSSFFVTLTYDNEHIPLTDTNQMTLDKKHVQDFLKRLRYFSTQTKIKYYAAGEYGSTTHRPHYHLIIFNATHENIKKAWTFGHIDVGTVTGASVAYTAKYINKGKTVPAHANDKRASEFSLMSKRLGVNYLTPAILAYHKADLNRNYITLDGGVKTPLPRYFRQKIYTEEERDAQNLLHSAQHADAEQERQREYVQRNGTIEGYTRERHERKVAALSIFRARIKSNRNKI